MQKQPCVDSAWMQGVVHNTEPPAGSAACWQSSTAMQHRCPAKCSESPRLHIIARTSAAARRSCSSSARCWHAPSAACSSRASPGPERSPTLAKALGFAGSAVSAAAPCACAQPQRPPAMSEAPHAPGPLAGSVQGSQAWSSASCLLRTAPGEAAGLSRAPPEQAFGFGLGPGLAGLRRGRCGLLALGAPWRAGDLHHSSVRPTLCCPFRAVEPLQRWHEAQAGAHWEGLHGVDFKGWARLTARACAPHSHQAPVAALAGAHQQRLR